MKLLFQTITKFILGIIMFGLLLFLPAGTFKYWNAWLLIGILFIPIFLVGLVLFIKDKELLKKRLNGKEKQREQKHVIFITVLIFILGFIIAGFDFKYNWSNIPLCGIITGAVILVLAYILYVEVMRENAYLSRTIEIQENQKVIYTGLYSIVRHPMYLATTLLFLSIPIVLGSIFSFVIFLLIPFVLAKRIKNEEEILKEGLQGYKDYMEKVKYRMIPFIW